MTIEDFALLRQFIAISRIDGGLVCNIAEVAL
jgi:hypothetical protein